MGRAEPPVTKFVLNNQGGIPYRIDNNNSGGNTGSVYKIKIIVNGWVY